MMSSRTLALHLARTQLHVAPRTRIPGARFNSSHSTPNPSQILKGQIISGLIGGGVVLIGGCIWYQFSGVKATVDASNHLSKTLADAKNRAADSLPPPNEAIDYLRKTAKSYTLFIPGASKVIDPLFDRMEELHRAHRNEVDSIIAGAYNDIKGVVNQGKPADLETGLSILQVLQKRGAELGQVAAKFTNTGPGE